MSFEAVRPYWITVNDTDGTVLNIKAQYERTHTFRTRKGDSISDGFRVWGHDDFQVWEWRGTGEMKLHAIYWMDELVDSGPHVLARIQLVAEGVA